MSKQSSLLIRNYVSAEGLAQIDHWVSKYPEDERQSAVMTALMIVQEENGYLTKEAMDAVAEYLRMPAVAVYEVSTFYSMYEHKPHGRNLINVCTTISCKLRNAGKVVQHIEKSLGITLGQTTEDGRFTLRAVDCLGACVNAPMMQINKDYHENLTADKINAVLEEYR